MLQQTQVSRVLPKYREFLDIFPDLYVLASASTADVLRAWKGMGYNRRALYLKRTAEIVTRQYKGLFPRDEAALRQLPGLGTYTARAILVFAFNKNVGAVDTNIRKILTHFFFPHRAPSETEVDRVAQILVPHGKAWEWHQALMDFGALELYKLLGPRRKIPQTRAVVPFKESNRFFRGRVIDCLREREVSETLLIEDFVRLYDRTEAFLRRILDGLIEDQLIERKNGRLSLPD